MITTLEIVDTAVKVGLGAVISGVITYFVARLNHKREIEKSITNRRIELLEGLAQQIQIFHTSALRYWALTCLRAEYERSDEEMPEDQLVSWREAYDEDVFPELGNAEAKLLLMGEVGCAKLARDYGNFVNEFRSASFMGGEKLSITVASELEEHRTQLLEKRAELFRCLSSVYMPRRT